MMSWNNPIPVAVCVVPVRQENSQLFRLLTIVRNIEPELGGVALPGGYIDELETAEEAASRELQEETGLVIHPQFWRPITTFMTPYNRLCIFMGLTYNMNDLVVLPHIEAFEPNREVRLLHLSNPGDTLCFSSHTEVLRHEGLWAN